jgi:tetratricopeptide (TPR) repeat protein
VIALQEASPAEALRRFEIVLGSNPSDVPALIGVLTSQFDLRRQADSRRTAAQLQDVLEDRDPRLLQVAALLAEHGETAAAIPVMERARRFSPESSDVNYNLAVAYFQTDQYGKAADVIRPFTSAGANAEACNLLGAIEEKRGRAVEAEHAFEEAAAREPSNESYRFDYGNSLLQHGKVEPAVQVFSAAVSDLPSSWKLRIGLGSAYYLASEYENAAWTLLEAVKLRPDSAAAWYLLGEAYDSAPSLQREIEAAFASYLETAPRDPGAYYHYGAILFQRAQADGRTDHQKAIQNLNQALRLNPNLAEVHFELGLIALAEGKTEQSIAELQKSINLEPGFAAAHYRLGLVYKRAGDETRAQGELNRFRMLKEDERQHSRVLRSLATIAR